MLLDSVDTLKELVFYTPLESRQGALCQRVA